jgi:para-aminobenzoate synthetase component 1
MIATEVALDISFLDLLLRLADTPRLVCIQGVRGPGGRLYSILGWAPRSSLEIRPDGAVVDARGETTRPTGDVLAAFDQFLLAHAPPTPASAFPFHGLAIGYLAYELRTAIEPSSGKSRDDLGLPRAELGWYDPVVIHDEESGRYVVASSEDASAVRERIATLKRRCAAPPPRPERNDRPPPTPLRSNMSTAAYHAAVARIHDHIRAGNVYQISLTQRLSAPVSGDPLALFTRLSRVHPMPRGAFIDSGRCQILCNSPELLLERRGAQVATAPIKGTRRRGRTPGEDAILREELARDPKERAEHVMIVDLERNDLGKVCRPGSVHVTSFARVNTYPTLHHLESTVEGTLRAGIGVADLLRAIFPGGSVTGAPKRRAMEIIDTLEPHARGVYTGAIGVFDAAGDAHLTLPIRTALIKDGLLHYGVGGGIVADSIAEREHEESMLKAEGLLRALGLRIERAA